MLDRIGIRERKIVETVNITFTKRKDRE